MKIEQLAVALPSRRVTNHEVVEEIARKSTKFSGDLSRVSRQIRRALQANGAVTRHWLCPGESSLALSVQACKKVMAGVAGDNPIDLLICAGVYSELVEPATANLVAHQIGLDHVECFDVKAACDGWMKTLRIASVFIESGIYRRIMVVNGEFPMTPGFGIYPELFNLSSSEQLEWRFPGFTLGEAATAMILGPDPDNVWTFQSKTRNDLFDLCTITMPWHAARPIPSQSVAKDGAGVFTSYGAKLHRLGFPLAYETFIESGINSGDVDILFTHSSSKRDWREGAEAIGLGNKIYDIYAERGNVVSAAVPAAMALAAEDGTLKRGQKVAVLVASAGMSSSAASFVF